MPRVSSNKYSRVSSPLTAAAAGAAVCLGAGSAVAASGTISASNAGRSAFNAGSGPLIRIFGSRARISFTEPFSGSGGSFNSDSGNLRFAVQNGSYMACVSANYVVNGALNFAATVQIPIFFLTPTYFPMSFEEAGETRYGWVLCPESDVGGVQLKLTNWSFNETGGPISTLDESVSTKVLPLSDGRVNLHWNNANEDGVARYEVQQQCADGVWAAVDSSTPGAGCYAASGEGGSEYRLIVENLNGCSRTLNF